MDLKRQIGLEPDTLKPVCRDELVRHVKLRLAAAGYDGVDENDPLFDVGRDLILNHREKSRLLATHLPPADRRVPEELPWLVQQWLEEAQCSGTMLQYGTKIKREIIDGNV